MKYIELKEVHFKYKKKPIISHVNLKLDGSQCTALVGPNGSGKTTLGKLMMGMLESESGVITYDEQPVSELSLSEVGARIGYLFQNPAKQIFAVTVRDDLTFPLRMNGEENIIIDQKFNHVIELFHLEKIVDAKCHLLSHGEKQRVALASIFMREPEFLILDEPTTGLDMIRKEALGNILEDIKEKGVGILMISHDRAFVEKHADKVLEMGAL